MISSMMSTRQNTGAISKHDSTAIMAMLDNSLLKCLTP